LGYNPNIPTSTDLLSNSQVDIKSNFLTANTVMGINHYAFDVVSGNQGKHKFTELVNLSTPAGTSQLCATPGTSGNEFQLTSMNNADFATFGTSPDGWTFLPGGLIMNWGTGMGQTDSSFTYSRDFTGAPYTVQVTPLDTNNGRIFLWVKTISATNFTIASRDSSGLDTTIKFTWIALGFA
jgi:hypothetical protein